MRKHYRKLVRNLALFACAVLCLGALIVYIAVTRKPTFIMPPETPEELVLRSSPDNAYFTLEEADRLFPKWPEPLVGPDPEYPQFNVVYKPLRGSLGETLQIKRPDDDPEFVQFIDACKPVVNKVREALKKPFYREPVKWSDYEEFGTHWEKKASREARLTKLGAILLASSLQTQRISGDDAASSACLLDAIRLSALLMTDGDGSGPGVRILRLTFSRIDAWARAVRSKEVLKSTLDALREIERGIPSPVAALEFQWRILDNTMRLPKQQMPGPMRFAGNTLLSWNMASTRGVVIRNRDELQKAVALDYSEYQAWLAKHPELKERHFGDQILGINPLDSVTFIVRLRTMTRAGFDGAILLLALEAYHREHDAYPDALDRLVPDFLGALPKDPYTGDAFVYKRESADYRLYSLGQNGRDDGGMPRKGDDYIVHGPSEPEELPDGTSPKVNVRRLRRAGNQLGAAP